MGLSGLLGSGALGGSLGGFGMSNGSLGSQFGGQKQQQQPQVIYAQPQPQVIYAQPV